MTNPRFLRPLFSVFVLLLLLQPAVLLGQEKVQSGSVQEYILSNIRTNDLVLLGERHKQPNLLKMMVGLIPKLASTGITHLALEIESDQQAAIESYLTTGAGLDKIRIHSQIDSPEYRNLLVIMRGIKARERPIAIAIDMPKSMYNSEMGRDEYMAKRLTIIFESHKGAKVLAYLGDYHVFKKLDWQDHVPRKRPAIREQLVAELPSLRIFSIGQIAMKPIDHCDFYETYHSAGPVAADIAERFKGWKLGMASGIAIKPAEPYELLDGLIVY